MIKSISLRNFQSHEDTYIELAPGVNVLVGTNDAGKTAVLRALRWVAENRPLGEHFRSRWGGPTAVDVEVEEQGKFTTVTRAKDRKNLYAVGSLELEGFGGDVPPAVGFTLDLDPVAIQMQHDGPFLLRESPGEVARVLGRASGLERIDGAVAWLTKQQRANTAEQTRLDKDREQVKTDLEGLAWVDEMDRAVTEAEELDRQAKNASDTAGRLRSLIWAATKASERLSATPDLTPVGKLVTKAENTASRLTQAEQTILKLAGLVERAGNLAKAMVMVVERGAESKFEFDRLMPDTCPLCGQTRAACRD